MSEAQMVRVCVGIRCHVVTYQTLAYPDHVDQACPSCGKIGGRHQPAAVTSAATGPADPREASRE